MAWYRFDLPASSAKECALLDSGPFDCPDHDAHDTDKVNDHEGQYCHKYHHATSQMTDSPRKR